MEKDKQQMEIIPPVERPLIEEELKDGRYIKDTNKAGNKIYIINHHNSPHTMCEIGRLREVSFRYAGGGTGLEMDVDEADKCERCYEQLIVYNPEDQEIIGGYRFISGERAYNKETEEYDLSTAHYFDFSEKMKQEYLPYSIELGRSWVQPNYQPAINHRKGVFALMNIWDGLGALVGLYPELKYFFGKVTMYTNYNTVARDILLSFMDHYFPNKLNLCQPKPDLYAGFDDVLFKANFQKDMSYMDGFKLLYKLLKEHGEWIPPLINIYMNLSPTMMTFGTARNPDFGDVEETGVLVTLADIHQEITDRHINY
ncbi:MAG: GNAT family N-acetyltransferase [Cytophagales bacterium]|nr:GNAT family N-acetyltransferase [Cytophagales bacterium]